ncbi:MAG: glycosyltransferase [Desulfobacteraceae bacterium]|nr:MAG: glycosyltransferase [Desulfobacteraceae bacterium]
MRILFFAESLIGGGTERRLLELAGYLKNNRWDIKIVITDNIIHYDYAFQLKIPIIPMERKVLKKDPTIFFRFYRFCKRFRPHIIHTWGKMTTFYAIPASLLLNIPLVNSQVADATIKENLQGFNGFIWRINKRFASVNVANSQAGFNAYGLKSSQGRVIHNGIRSQRFENLTSKQMVKQKYGIQTPYAVVMVASFTEKKDYHAYLTLSREIYNIRKDISFVAAGHGPLYEAFRDKVSAKGPETFIFIGRTNDVEDIINCCDIGILLSHGEGMSNAILEYMALKKPVIATNAGGTKEIVKNGVNGYLIDNKNINGIVSLLIDLIENPNKREEMGEAGRKTINRFFTVEKMGAAFLDLYEIILENNNLN